MKTEVKVKVLRRVETPEGVLIEVMFSILNVRQISRFLIPLEEYSPEREVELIEAIKEKLWKRTEIPPPTTRWIYMFEHKVEIAPDLPPFIQAQTLIFPRELTTEEVDKLEGTLGMRLRQVKKVVE